MNVWIGTSGFQYPEWKGGFYPADLAASKMLSFYAGRLNSTESNYSFRRIPSLATIEKWSAATPAAFRFSFKAPQKVTHFARLNECADTLEFFAKVLAAGREKTGPVLFQLPPNFKKDAEKLRNFFPQVPAGMRAAFEFRHDSWFDSETYDILREAGAALCVAEDEDLATPAVSTGAFGYLRLRREDYQPADIQRWADFVKSQAGAWSDVYIYFKHEETGVGPKFAVQMQKALG